MIGLQRKTSWKREIPFACQLQRTVTGYSNVRLHPIQDLQARTLRTYGTEVKASYIINRAK